MANVKFPGRAKPGSRMLKRGWTINLMSNQNPPEEKLAAWTSREAAQRYANVCSQERTPMVVECPQGVDFREVTE